MSRNSCTTWNIERERAMLGKIVSLVSVFVLMPGLAACEKVPPKILSEPGVTRLNGEQARAHISGNTEK